MKLRINTLIIVLLALCLSNFELSAQCTPDPSYEIYDLGVFPFPFNLNPDNPNFPDSAYVGVTDTIYTGEPWSMTFTAIVPEELDFGGVPTAMDYVRVDQVNGLPPGFDYECSAVDCNYESGTHCFIVSGTTWVPGDYNITVDIYAKMSGIQELPFLIPPDPDNNGLNFPEGTYTATVVSLTNITELSLSDLSGAAFPNPFEERLNLSFNAEKYSEISLTISDVTGSLVQNETYQSSKGTNTISINSEAWSTGVYFYEISDGYSSITGKVIKR